MKLSTAGILMMLGSLLHAGSVGLNINSDDIEIESRIDINPFATYGSGTRYTLSGAYLHTESDDLFRVGFGASSTLPDAEGLTVTLGVEGVFGNDYVSMPFFGRAAFRLPLDPAVPVTTLSTELAYAPSVLTFLDGEHYLAYRFETDVEVISNVHLYGGYRNIDTDYESYDYNLNDRWYGGLKISF